jgi:hypothetical protein
MRLQEQIPEFSGSGTELVTMSGFKPDEECMDRKRKEQRRK